MKRVLTALVLIPLVLLLVFKAPLWAIALVTCIVALLATHEYLNIIQGYGTIPLHGLTYAGELLLFAWITLLLEPAAEQVGRFRHPFGPFMLLAILPFLLLVFAMRRTDLRDALLAAATSFFGIVYIGLALASLILSRYHEDGAFWLLILFASVWAGDSVAMYVGKSLGRRKLAPRVSPNKTWEGAAGSVVGAVIAAAIVFHFRHGINSHTRLFAPMPSDVFPSYSLVGTLALAIILNIAGQLGDLAESVIKRGANVKDSGTLLPGHGGILDRIDALLFAAPVLWYYLAIFRS